MDPNRSANRDLGIRKSDVGDGNLLFVVEATIVKRKLHKPEQIGQTHKPALLTAAGERCLTTAVVRHYSMCAAIC